MKVLVVDDSKIDRYVLERLLKKALPQASVIQKENGRDAIDDIRNQADNEQADYNLIFIDLSMPVMSGREFLIEYSRNRFYEQMVSTKVIVITSSEHPEDRGLLNEFTFVTDYFVKPLKIERLAELLKAFA